LKILVSVTSFMFALHFLKINIPRAVACYRTTEATASLLACLLWLLMYLLLMSSGTKIHNSYTSALHFIPNFLLPIIHR
jgi:hypothetical protein